MEFRWVALIALWTLLAGPLFDHGKGSRPVQARAQLALRSR